jgi:hypothetical protein
MVRLLRYLRIGWTVGWGVVAVSLIALWVRSYYWEDLLYRVGNAEAICFESRFGQVSVDKGFAPPSRSYSPGTYHRNARRHSDDGIGLGYYDGKGGSRFVIDLYLPGRWRCAAPHWFVSLLSVAIASVAWLPPTSASGLC